MKEKKKKKKLKVAPPRIEPAPELPPAQKAGAPNVNFWKISVRKTI